MAELAEESDDIFGDGDDDYEDGEDYGNGGESVRMIPKSTHVINSDDSEEELDL